MWCFCCDSSKESSFHWLAGCDDFLANLLEFGCNNTLALPLGSPPRKRVKASTGRHFSSLVFSAEIYRNLNTFLSWSVTVNFCECWNFQRPEAASKLLLREDDLKTNIMIYIYKSLYENQVIRDSFYRAEMSRSLARKQDRVDPGWEDGGNLDQPVEVYTPLDDSDHLYTICEDIAAASFALLYALLVSTSFDFAMGKYLGSQDVLWCGCAKVQKTLRAF